MDVAKKRSHGKYELLPFWIYLLIGFAAITLTTLAGVWLWSQSQPPPLPSGTDSLSAVQQADLALKEAQLRADTIRNILGVAAGVGALTALILALRKQYVSEHDNRVEQEYKDRTAATSEHDAAERRITELYVKAADQLGSDKASVRLAGLYALERLAQDNAQHRQTIVDLICAYLRMPYNSPSMTYYVSGAHREKPGSTEAIQESRVEQEVRVTAQTMLRRHTVVTSKVPLGYEAFWPDLVLDLTGATLVDLNLSDCKVRELRVTHASFQGDGLTNLSGLHVTGYLGAYGAEYSGPVTFENLQTDDMAHFGKSTFLRDAIFRQARFGAFVDFAGCRFKGRTSYENAVFRIADVVQYLFSGARTAIHADANVPDYFPIPWRISTLDVEDGLALLVMCSESDERTAITKSTVSNKPEASSGG